MVKNKNKGEEMKKLFIVVFVLVLVGCATQKSLQTQKWHVQYLEQDLQNQKELSTAYADSLKTIQNLADELKFQVNGLAGTLSQVNNLLDNRQISIQLNNILKEAGYSHLQRELPEPVTDEQKPTAP